MVVWIDDDDGCGGGKSLGEDEGVVITGDGEGESDEDGVGDSEGLEKYTPEDVFAGTGPLEVGLDGRTVATTFNIMLCVVVPSEL